MKLWEFTIRATPHTAITFAGAYVTVEKNFLTGVGVMILSTIISLILIYPSFYLENFKQKYGG